MATDAKLKSLFIFPAAILSLLILVVSIGMLALASGYRLMWFGAALSALPIPLLLTQLKMRPVARTSEFLPLHLLLCAVGTVLAMQGMYSNFTTSWGLYNDIGGALKSAVCPGMQNRPGLAALLAATLFLLYVFWYSRFGRFNDARLDVGGKMPEFELKTVDGKTIQSTDLIGNPAVFLFYRGNWCPLCMAQIDEIVERYGEIERLGIQVCLVSPQPEEETRTLAERHGVGFHFLVDENNRVARGLGIALSNGVPIGVSGNYDSDTVLPTMFVTSAGGTIVFSDQTDNYRVRPEPDIFLAILRRAGAMS